MFTVHIAREFQFSETRFEGGEGHCKENVCVSHIMYG